MGSILFPRCQELDAWPTSTDIHSTALRAGYQELSVEVLVQGQKFM